MISASFNKKNLVFKQPARTSRNVMMQKTSWYLLIEDKAKSITGIGECSPIAGLSIENMDLFEGQLSLLCKEISNQNKAEIKFDFNGFPSMLFGYETALKDLENGGKKLIFNNDFFTGRKTIPINGLIWMSDFGDMMEQVRGKINSGFNCIKIKMGAMHFDEELQFLKKVRKEYPQSDIILRLDANGAFLPINALENLERLSELEIHSIEQPIRQGHVEQMVELCEKSPLKIALDEELIGVAEDQKARLIELIRPAFLILKPTLLGGYKNCDDWIRLADKTGIGWWITSALESNVGLNAIAQWTAEYETDLHQGLGTGGLYSNNVESPLYVEVGRLKYAVDRNWGTLDFKGDA
jgi:L-Ala-D/L-Glu epimerase